MDPLAKFSWADDEDQLYYADLFIREKLEAIEKGGAPEPGERELRFQAERGQRAARREALRNSKVDAQIVPAAYTGIVTSQLVPWPIEPVPVRSYLSPNPHLLTQEQYLPSLLGYTSVASSTASLASSRSESTKKGGTTGSGSSSSTGGGGGGGKKQSSTASSLTVSSSSATSSASVSSSAVTNTTLPYVTYTKQEYILDFRDALLIEGETAMLDAKLVIMDGNLWRHRTADLRKVNEATRKKEEEIQKLRQDNSNVNGKDGIKDKKSSTNTGTGTTGGISTAGRPRAIDVAQLLDVKVVFGLEEERGSTNGSRRNNSSSSDGNRNGTHRLGSMGSSSSSSSASRDDDIASSPWAMRKRNIAGAAAVARQESLNSSGPNTPVRGNRANNGTINGVKSKNDTKDDDTMNVNLRSKRTLSFDDNHSHVSNRRTSTVAGTNDWENPLAPRSVSSSSSSTTTTTTMTTTGVPSSSTTKLSSSSSSSTNTVVLAPQFREIPDKILSSYDTRITKQWKTIYDNGNVPTGIQQKRKRIRQDYFQTQRQRIMQILNNNGNGTVNGSNSSTTLVNEHTIFYPAVGSTFVPLTVNDTWWSNEAIRFPWLTYPDQRLHPLPETVTLPYTTTGTHGGEEMEEEEANMPMDGIVPATTSYQPHRCPRRDWDYAYYGDLLTYRPSLRAITAEGYMDGYSIRNAWLSALQNTSGSNVGIGGNNGYGSHSTTGIMTTTTTTNIASKSKKKGSVTTDTILSKQLLSKLRISSSGSSHNTTTISSQQQEAKHQRRLERGSYGNGTGNINDEYDYDYHKLDNKKRYNQHPSSTTGTGSSSYGKGNHLISATSPFVLSPVHPKPTNSVSRKQGKGGTGTVNENENEDTPVDDEFTFDGSDDNDYSSTLNRTFQRQGTVTSMLNTSSNGILETTMGKFYKTASIPPTLPRNSKVVSTRVHLRLNAKPLAAPVYAIGIQRSSLRSHGNGRSSTVKKGLLELSAYPHPHANERGGTGKVSSFTRSNTGANVGSSGSSGSSNNSNGSTTNDPDNGGGGGFVRFFGRLFG